MLKVFQLKDIVKGSIDNLSNYFVKEYGCNFSFVMFEEILYFFNLSLDEEKLWDLWRLFASNIVSQFSPENILLDDWCQVLFLILQSFVIKVNLQVDIIKRTRKCSEISYKICLKIIDFFNDYSNSEGKTKP